MTGTLVYFETERLMVRDMKASDVPGLIHMRTDPAMQLYLEPSKSDPEEWVRNMFADMQGKEPGEDPGDWYNYVLEEKSTGKLVGDIGVGFLHPGPGQAELGYRIASDAQGRGYATEALGIMIDHLFTTHGLHRLHALIAAGNEPSWRLVERLGFRREGVLKEAFLKQGVWTDDYIYGLLKSEWQKSE